jgi:8-oxo-dGTP pyrophosphatase MutT (NUDIX family)
MASLKPSWFYAQSAVIPYVLDDNEIRIVLVTSRTRMRWIIPKGIIEPGLSPLESARQEALEEAGVKGKIFPQDIGTYSYKKWKGTCTVKVFVMQVRKMLDMWEEEWLRTRELVSIEEAIKRIDEEELRKMIQTVPAFVDEIEK